MSIITNHREFFSSIIKLFNENLGDFYNTIKNRAVYELNFPIHAVINSNTIRILQLIFINEIKIYSNHLDTANKYISKGDLKDDTFNMYSKIRFSLILNFYCIINEILINYKNITVNNLLSLICAKFTEWLKNESVDFLLQYSYNDKHFDKNIYIKHFKHHGEACLLKIDVNIDTIIKNNKIVTERRFPQLKEKHISALIITIIYNYSEYEFNKAFKKI